ncbi:MAG: alanine racemase [Chitinispirillaceae bacterium]|nr:alanine racemase [Chitinispirillaceae bacterium]
MSRLHINIDALKHNIKQIEHIIKRRNNTWTLVTKVLCGYQEIIEEFVSMGLHSFGDTRLENMYSFPGGNHSIERWYLRVPPLSITEKIVDIAEVSINSEIATIRQLDKHARAAGKTHKIIVMIELGDLREGVLPGSLIDFYTSIFSLPNIEVLGIGANIGCLSGIVPSIDQLMQLVLYRELLELKFGHKLPLISAGTSATLSLLENKHVPEAVNHWRIGESVFLGNDLVNGGTLKGFRNDTFILEAEIAEIKKKGMVPIGEVANVAPFDTTYENEFELSPGQRGRRALITIGELDTDVRGLIPMSDSCRIVGASSDISVIHINDEDDSIKVGGTLRFRLTYSALLRLMNGRYIPKIIKRDSSVSPP